MKRLVARARRAAARAVRGRPRVIQEDVCWCGIHHLGAGYVHLRPTGVWWVPNVDNPACPTTVELAAGIRLDQPKEGTP